MNFLISFLILCFLSPSYFAFSAEELDHLVLNTEKGPVIIEMDTVGTPIHFSALTKLVEMGVYTGTKFTFAQEGFYVQLGNEEHREFGFYQEQRELIKKLPNEITNFKHYRAAVTMPNSPDDELKGGDYVFTIMLDQSEELDENQTIIGFVVRGLDILDELSKGANGEEALKNPLKIENAVFMNKKDALAYSDHNIKTHFESDIFKFSLFSFLLIMGIQLLAHFGKEKIDQQIIESMQVIVLLIATFSFLAQSYPLVADSTIASVLFVAALLLCFKVMASLERSRGLTK
ncbi:MAG: hypothetical protein CME65_03310 [Halobacteriovoraceae bacterium]|nr:hypothetical protein [Halobacteriovoraceae bacterium]|tara:strand:+ start:10914 stop:11780 length:867 start_codon:yes stop_codon:yes gene_type:complete